MKSILNFAFLIVIMISFSTCFYYNEDIRYPKNQCDTTNITYSGKINAIFVKNNCFSCHSTAVAPPDGGGIRLDIYAVAKEKADRIYGAVTHQSGFIAMPFGQIETIDPCDIKIIRIWKDSGTPEN